MIVTFPRGKNLTIIIVGASRMITVKDNAWRLYKRESQFPSHCHGYGSEKEKRLTWSPCHDLTRQDAWTRRSPPCIASGLAGSHNPKILKALTFAQQRRVLSFFLSYPVRQHFTDGFENFVQTMHVGFKLSVKVHCWRKKKKMKLKQETNYAAKFIHARF